MKNFIFAGLNSTVTQSEHMENTFFLRTKLAVWTSYYLSLSMTLKQQKINLNIFLKNFCEHYFIL